MRRKDKDIGGIGYMTALETRQRLFPKIGQNVPWYETATLEKLREVERNFLLWYPLTHHPDKELKRKIYEEQIKPRIALLSGSGVQQELI